MNIEISGDKIILKNTVISDIDEIVDFENFNEQYVHHISENQT